MVLRCVENSSARIAHVYNACGGEGGIRTLGTLIRGTHDFQSCTFNRSVTSPYWDFKYLDALPYRFNGQCLQNVSTGVFGEFSTYHKDLARTKIIFQVVNI